MPPTNSLAHPSERPVAVEVIPGGPVGGTIQPPGSKSLTNRALLCAAFANGVSTLTGALRSEDTEVMIDALGAIGVKVTANDGGRELIVDATDRQHLKSSSDRLDLYIANSGTTIRFLTAALSAAGGHFLLHGVQRMHQRPIADLVNALTEVQSGSIATQSPNGCPPVLIQSDGWHASTLSVAGSLSSQFLSGLMMAAPIADTQNQPTQIEVQGELVSIPYVEMTARVIESFGGHVSIDNVPNKNAQANSPANDDQAPSIKITVGPAQYRPQQYAIEPDASAASYFWAAAAITGGDITVTGLSADAMQGDVGFCEVLGQMGCQIIHSDNSIRVIGNQSGGSLRGVDVNMNAISDTVQTLAVVALFAGQSTRVRGVAHNRFKETDRIGDLATELRKLGAKIDEHEDGLTIHPIDISRPLEGATLETYHDHRMAMSLSLAGLRLPGVKILNPACTSKTYPEYFAELENLIGRPHHWA